MAWIQVSLQVTYLSQQSAKAYSKSAELLPMEKRTYLEKANQLQALIRQIPPRMNGKNSSSTYPSRSRPIPGMTMLRK